MPSWIERALGLNEGEFRRAWPLFAYLLLTTTGTVAIKAARDALFLDRFSPTDLPYVDIAVAVLVGLSAGLYIRLGRRLDLPTLQVSSLVFFAANAIAFWWWPRQGAGAQFIAIYVWVGIFSVLLPTQVWTLADSVLTTREAKRSFGFVGSGAILGWIAGGLITRTLAARFGADSMLLFVAASLLASTVLVMWVWHGRPDQVDEAGPASGEDERAGWLSGGLYGSIVLLRQSRYLQSIAVLILMSAMATTVAGWQFKAIAKAAIPNTDDLAVFFGTFNTIAGIVSLVVQLLLTARVLRTAGVGVALFIVPTALLAGSAGVLAAGSLLAVSWLKASDQVLRYSIDKATTELLYLPVAPNLTFRVKSFVDTVVYRLGDAGGGLLILLFAAALGWSPVAISWVCVACIGGWIAAAAVARKQYVENLRESIHQHRVDTEKARAPVASRETTRIIGSRLKGSPDEIAYALSLFQLSPDRAVHPAVRGLLHHERPDIRRQAVALLARARDHSARPEVEALLTDPDLEVRTEALLYLSTYDSGDPIARIERMGQFADFSVRAALVAFLARPGPSQKLEAARLMLAAMADERGPDGARTRLEAARLLGHLPDAFDRELRRLLDDDDLDVAKAAISAVGRLKKRAVVGRIVERLDEPALAPTVLQALARMGDGIVGSLRDLLSDESSPLAVLRQIPAALQAIGTTSAQAALAESVVQRDVVLRYNVIAALNKLAQLHPGPVANREEIASLLDAEIMGHYRSYQVLGTLGAAFEEAADPVVHGIQKSIIRESERIFRLLKILYPDRDMHSAYVGLRSDDPVVHDNAVEFLDSILGPEMRGRLLPLFDRDVTPAQRLDAANRALGTTLADGEEAVAVMSLSQDPWLRSCAAFAIGEMRLERFADRLDAWAEDDDLLLRATAVDARERLARAAGDDPPG